MKAPLSNELPPSLDKNRVLSAKQAAALIGVSETTFRREYWAGRTPAAIRLSTRRIGWRVDDLLKHLATHEATNAA